MLLLWYHDVSIASNGHGIIIYVVSALTHIKGIVWIFWHEVALLKQCGASTATFPPMHPVSRVLARVWF